MTVETFILTMTALGAALLALGVLLLRRRRWTASVTASSGGALALASALVLGGVTSNLYTYHRFTAEQDIAWLHFRTLGPQHYLARLRLADGRRQDLDIWGDEWQLDARILKWRGLATWLGMDTVFRLERLSGRYQDLEKERNSPRSVHDLSPGIGLDLWAFARRHGDRLPWVDTVYGSAAYLPMANDSRFVVTVSASGLVARPVNEAARQALGQWN